MKRNKAVSEETQKYLKEYEVRGASYLPPVYPNLLFLQHDTGSRHFLNHPIGTGRNGWSSLKSCHGIRCFSSAAFEALADDGVRGEKGTVR